MIDHDKFALQNAARMASRERDHYQVWAFILAVIVFIETIALAVVTR